MTVKCLFCKDTKIEPGIPGQCIWCETVGLEISSTVERFTIAKLRYAGGLEHNVRYVSEVHYDAALAEREALQQRLTIAEQRASMLEREFKRLRDVAHDCYGIASSYSGCIDGVEEHGGDDHEDPSCAIFHRLYYAMFDADRALKPAAEGDGQ